MEPIFNSPLSFEDLCAQLPSEMLAVFANAIFIGNWPDGRPVTQQQKEICTQVLQSREFYDS